MFFILYSLKMQRFLYTFDACMHVQIRMRNAGPGVTQPDGLPVPHAEGEADRAEGVRAGRRSPEGQVINVSTVGVGAVAVSPTGDRFTTGSDDHVAAIWDAGSGQRIRKMLGHSGLVWAVPWSPCGTKVATASADATAAIWDASSGQRMHVFRGHGSTVRSVAWSHDVS